MIKRNKVLAYVTVLFLLLVATFVLVSKPTAMAFVRDRGGYESAFYESYDKHRTQIKDKVSDYCQYVLYGDTAITDVEHIFAQSWATAVGKPSICNDYYNLRISDQLVNRVRGACGFGCVQHSEENVVFDSEGKLAGYTDGAFFEPMDEFKGDVARTLLYIFYNYGLGQEEVRDYFDVGQMVSWAKLDAVSDAERAYSREIQSAEGYANLFIVRPSIIYLF